MAAFSIQRQWVSALNETPEVSQTSAMLKIVLGHDVVTRNEDEWAQTVRDDVRLSAYPLALWFAASWWRLRWEPIPTFAPSHSWRMAHELRAAGHGYVWPRMLFASDGENIHIWAVQSSPDSKPVRYLTNAHNQIAASEFERSVSDFILSVIARLDAVGVPRTELHELWSEISEERNDNTLAADRRLEALLGFDPDESSEILLRRIKELIPAVGAAAVSEIAAVCASRDRLSTFNAIVSFAESRGISGRMALPVQAGRKKGTDVIPAWERGREFAREVRENLGLNGAPVTDTQLCDLIGVSTASAFESEGTRDRTPLGMAVLDDTMGHTKFLFRKRNRPGRRFEIARFICDHLIADRNDRWLPITDEKTSRQKAQRAFAAEFLCPVDALSDYLAGDFSNDAIDEAAEHFGVSTRAIETQLVNHDILPAEILIASKFDFPYFAHHERL